MIYFIQGALTRLIKIGKAIDCERRLKNMQCGSPDKLHIIKQVYVSNDVEAEYLLHSRFHFCRQHGEWFSPDEKLVKFMETLEIQNRVFTMAQQLDKMGCLPSNEMIKREATKTDVLKSKKPRTRPAHSLNAPTKNYTEKSLDWRQEKRLRREVESFRRSLEARGIKTSRRKPV